jgi:UDP-glucose 4-epimerase
MGMNWLITGGCGFIGTSLVQHLINSEQEVNIRILDNLSVGTKADLAEICNFKEYTPESIPNFPQGIEFFSGDIRNPKDCMNACRGMDIIVHLAANSGVALSVENPRCDMEANVNGTVNVLEAARANNISKFIFASSGAPIGEVEPPIHEEKVPRPVSPYGASKLAGEGYCSAYFRTFGIKTIALRFGNVYGPRSKHKSSVIAKFFRNALENQPLEIYGNGGQTRDFIYIDDLIQAIVLAARAPFGGEVFQIATDKETTINKIADHIKRIVKERMGIELKVVHKGERLGDVMRNYSDISKAKKYLGFKPEYDLAEGLELTFNYFKKQADISVKS